MDHLALATAVFLGGLVSGFSGFAFSAAAGAILLHFLPPMQAIPLMMICSIATQATSVLLVRKHVVWTDVMPLLIGGAAGLPIALFLLTRMEPRTFAIAFGLLSPELCALHAVAAGARRRAQHRQPGHEFRRGLLWRLDGRAHRDAGGAARHLVRPARHSEGAPARDGAAVHPAHADFGVALLLW